MVRRAASRGVVGTPKNGRTREVELSDQAVAALREHPRRGPLVFCDAEAKMLTKGATKWPLWTACRAAGLRQIGYHVLRHTFASHLVMRGVPIRTVQELLGHSTIEMTMRYSHLSPDARRNAVKVLDVKEPISLTWTTSKGVVLKIPLDRNSGFARRLAAA
jgi:site-specific recombinase XerD